MNDCPISDETYQECKEIFEDQEWFHLYMYVKKKEINKYTLHIHHKVLRIQKVWQVYSHNPSTDIGFNKMMKSVFEMNNMF
jgi:hypothetical protein